MPKIEDWITEVVKDSLFAEISHRMHRHQIERDEAAAAAATVRAFLAEAAKAGWEMKPREITDEMVIAWIHIVFHGGNPDKMAAQADWTAMFDAAPKLEG